MPADHSQRESITFLVTAEDNTSTTAERFTGILELNTHEYPDSSALKWLVVSGFGLNNFNLRINGNRLELWVLPTVGTISFAVLSETMSGEDVRFIELFDVAESARRTGTSLGNSEKLTIMTSPEIKAAYESNSNTNAYTDADKAKVDSIDLNVSVGDETIYWQGTTSAPLGNIITDMLGQPKNSLRTNTAGNGVDLCSVYELTVNAYDDNTPHQGKTLIYVPNDTTKMFQFYIMLVTGTDTSLKVSHYTDMTSIPDVSGFGYQVLLKLVATNQLQQHIFS